MTESIRFRRGNVEIEVQEDGKYNLVVRISGGNVLMRHWAEKDFERRISAVEYYTKRMELIFGLFFLGNGIEDKLGDFPISKKIGDEWKQVDWKEFQDVLEECKEEEKEKKGI